MDNIVEELCEPAIKHEQNFLSEVLEKKKKKGLWEKSIKKACEATEEIKDSFVSFLLGSPAIQRHFAWLVSNRSLDGIYHSFIITVAFELREAENRESLAESLGIAILDNWFELNKLDYPESRNISRNDIEVITHDREKLCREYFLLYDEPLSKDIIRVYYPQNGEKWLNCRKECSVEVRVNLSRGTEYGFCRIGFSYVRVKEDGTEKKLIIAFVNDDREIFRFDHINSNNIDEKNILWAQ